MKTYIYTYVKTIRKSNGPTNVYNVFRIKKNTPVFIGKINVVENRTKGDYSEVLNLLCEKKEVPEKALKEDSGYYRQFIGEKYNFTILDMKY